jgi:hypothetical protein
MRFILPLFLVSLFLTACGRGDSKQQQLTGTWVADFPNGVRSTSTVHPDGSYSARLDGYTNGSVITLEGHVRLEDGVIVDTCTKHSQTNTRVPFVTHGYIVHMDSHEIIAKWEGSMYDTVTMRKVER